MPRLTHLLRAEIRGSTASSEQTQHRRTHISICYTPAYQHLVHLLHTRLTPTSLADPPLTYPHRFTSSILSHLNVNISIFTITYVHTEFTCGVTLRYVDMCDMKPKVSRWTRVAHCMLRIYYTPRVAFAASACVSCLTPQQMHAYQSSAKQCLDVYECRVSATYAENNIVCTRMWQLSKCIGGCERIVQTPVPLHYARHTGRFMGLFILTLPFILVDDMVRNAS